jgi:probable F420-dependent oxidoreductase
MPWSAPAARMRDFVQALRAIWSAWQTGSRLDYEGEFYSHTLMLPFFSPPPGSWQPPRVFVAAVGELMTETVGSVADGMLLHPFTTARYIAEATVPALRRGQRLAGREGADIELSLAGLVVTGRDDREMEMATAGARETIAFYGSTRAYCGVLTTHGWSALAGELARYPKSAGDERSRILGLIDDEVVDTLAVRAEPDRLGPAIQARFGSLIDRWSFYTPAPVDPELLAPALAYLRQSDRGPRTGAAVAGAPGAGF